MNQVEKHQLAVDSTKMASGWASAYFAGMTASDVAALLAATYTFLLILDFMWSKVFRRAAIRIGWIKPQRADDNDTKT